MSYQIGQVKEYLALKKFDTPPSIGLRINPVVGGGQISAMSTATKLSKFGLPLMDDSRERLLQVKCWKLNKENKSNMLTDLCWQPLVKWNPYPCWESRGSNWKICVRWWKYLTGNSIAFKNLSRDKSSAQFHQGYWGQVSWSDQGGGYRRRPVHILHWEGGARGVHLSEIQRLAGQWGIYNHQSFLLFQKLVPKSGSRAFYRQVPSCHRVWEVNVS